MLSAELARGAHFSAGLELTVQACASAGGDKHKVHDSVLQWTNLSMQMMLCILRD